MKYKKLNTTDIDVSVICLGTMTWGNQNSQDDAFEQMDYALSQGVNFIDTAEMYSVPTSPERVGNTETIIGNYFAARKNRDKFILATKVAGPNPGLSYVRGGPRLNKAHIQEAIEGSLKRLQTDYVDLYQLHWPDRNSPRFGPFNYEHNDSEVFTPIEESLAALNDLVKAGYVRYIGLSNESPWGVMRFLELAKNHGMARVVTIQNHYNLLDRSYEMGLAEVGHRENVGLLAYSPLAMGALSGKYMHGIPEGSRFHAFGNFMRFNRPEAKAAIKAYVELAQANDLDPSQMALAYVNTRSFLTSNIIGATTMAQLKLNIASIDVDLSPDVLAGIEEIHRTYRNLTR